MSKINDILAGERTQETRFNVEREMDVVITLRVLTPMNNESLINFYKDIVMLYEGTEHCTANPNVFVKPILTL